MSSLVMCARAYRRARKRRPEPDRRAAAPWFLPLAVLVAVVFAVPRAEAQQCTSKNPPCPPNEPPTITFAPSGSALSVSPTNVTVYATDDQGMSATVTMRLNGNPISWPSLNLNYTTTSGNSDSPVTLVSGTNTLTATICDTEPGAPLCSTISKTYTYTPPPPPTAKAAPIISLAPHNSQYRNVAVCAGCADPMLSYTTPAHMSLDQPSSIGLFYSNAQAYPRGFVQVDVTDNSELRPNKLSIQLRRSSGILETLTLGTQTTQEIFYAVGGPGPYRVAAQFDARALGTGAHDYTLEIRSHWSDGTTLQSSTPIRVLIVDEDGSPFGWGWSLSGLQRIQVDHPDGALIIIEGDGAIAFFARGSCDGSGNCSYTTPEGDFSAVQYVASTGKYIRRYPDGSQLTFGSTGLLESANTRFGSSTTTYSWSGNLLHQITDPAGWVTTFGYGVNGSYGAPGKLAWITGAGGRTVNLGYDAAGNLTTIVGPDGVTALRAAFDADHRLLTHWDRTNAQTDFGYDMYNMLATVTAAQVTTSDAGPYRPVTQIRSMELTALPPAGTGTLSSPAPGILWFDAMLQTTEPRGGGITRVLPHRSGLPSRVAVQDPTGAWKDAGWTRNEHGQTLSESTPSGGSVSYAWDGPRLLTTTYNSTGTKITYTYEPSFSQVQTVSVNDSLVMKNFFSGAWLQPDSTAEYSGKDTSVTRFTYDGRGRVVTVRDPDFHQTAIVYETTGALNTQSVTGGTPPRTTSFLYDGYGRVRQTTDPAGRVVTTSYDPINRVTSETGPLSTSASYAYDDMTRTYTVTDAESQVYRIVLNALGWTETETDPRGGIQRYAYDKNGNLTTYTNRRGGPVTFTYDILNRLMTRTADGQTTTFAYDVNLKWIAAANGESLDTVKTDYAGRTDQMISIRGVNRYVLQPTYNNDGLRNGLRLRIKDGQVGQQLRNIDYGYDALGRLNLLEDLSNKAASLAYNKDHLPTTIKLPTGTTETSKLTQTFFYTPMHAVSKSTYNLLANSLERRYSHDILNRLTQIARGPTNNITTRTATYDAVGRLASYKDRRDWIEREQVCPGGSRTDCYYEDVPYSQVLRQDTLTYDKVGNRTNKGAGLEAGSNRLLSFDGYSLEYDADGNIKRKYKVGILDQYFTWNSLGQLTQVTTNGQVTTFGYDGWGRRVRKTSSGVTTQFVWDGDDLAMELDASGNTVREYTYYPGVDAPQSVRRSSDGATFYYVTEQPGHVAALVNVSNAIVNSYEYTPFGEQVSASEQVIQPLRYMGREYDSDSKLYYVRARYYDPQLGRFLSEDPIGLGGGINPYAYVGNDPINFTDPSGLCPECEEEEDPISHIMSARVLYPGGGGSAFPAWGVNPPATTLGPQQNPGRPGSGGGPGPQRPNAPQRTPDECFRENTSWIRSEGGKILGVGVGAIGTALTGGGVLAKVQGAQWIAQGTIDLDIFFGTKRPPSSLLQRGMSLGTDGRSMIRVGSRLLRGGTWTLAAGATFLASYLGTTKLICSVNPDYGL